MKIAIAVALLGLVLLHKTGAEIQCVQGSDGTTKAANCVNTVTRCSQPLFTDYQGFADGVEYACGPCEAKTKDVTCTECEANEEDGCNKPVQLGTSYSCYSFQFNKFTAKFIQLPDKATCTIASGSAVKCNNPTSTSAKDTYTNKNGCGPCDAGTTDNGLCEDCDSALCNPLPYFKCYTYTYNIVKEKYTPTDTTCKRSKDAGINCNMPATKDTAALYTNTDGCGGCAGSTKTDGACKECTDKALCNVLKPSSAERATATLLLPLAALLYCFI